MFHLKGSVLPCGKNRAFCLFAYLVVATVFQDDICEQDGFRDAEKLFRLFLKRGRRQRSLMQPFAESAGMNPDPVADICHRQIMDHTQACQNTVANRRSGHRTLHETEGSG